MKLEQIKRNSLLKIRAESDGQNMPKISL